jgi:O-methyltransferase involved in polyketide biosynthesis
MWNYWLGGKDNFAADREAAERVLEAMPSLPLIARAARLFLIDAVHQLAAEHGVRQFLDIGTGLPTADNTHDVAQRAAPESKIVYVDYDPVVLTHAQALLTSSPEGVTDYIQADLRDTDTILKEASRTLDLTRPVAVLLIAVLHFIPDADDPCRIVATLRNALAPGSYLVVSHGTDEGKPDVAQAAEKVYQRTVTANLRMRSRSDILRFFDGFELVDPGLVPMPYWRPDSPTELPQDPGKFWGGLAGVARKS